MVRFCDKDIVSANYDSINRQGLLRYFLRGHIDDMVCVFNADNMYMGNITYCSLLYNEDLEAAMDKGMLVLNEDIWTNAREMFENHRSYLDKHPLLPVVDTAGQLISFVYEDSDANRELRQLRELTEKSDAVQFHDIYPEYDCVIIYGFNELAYFFAGYLKEQGIPVRVEDAMWEGFFQSDEMPFMEHRCMKIYAEGTWAKPSNWQENLLRSVSVEFECIDAIYEENIGQGYIKDAACGDEEFLVKLKNAEAVAVFGTDIASQDAYDFLRQEGIEVKCFAVSGNNVLERKLFGKPIYNLLELKEKYGGNIVLVNNHGQNSTWGVFGLDRLDYLGYRRNERLFLMKDYIKIQGNRLRTALKNEKIVLTGYVPLCERLARYFEKHNITGQNNVSYINLTDEEIPDRNRLNITDVDSVCRDSICLIVLPEYFSDSEDDSERYHEKRRALLSQLREKGLIDYTDYFSSMETFIDIEKENNIKYPDRRWKVKRIVLGAIEYHSGNIFLADFWITIRLLCMIHASTLNYNLFGSVSCWLMKIAKSPPVCWKGWIFLNGVQEGS